MIDASNINEYKMDLTYTYNALQFFISESNMKTPDEAALTFAIIGQQNFLTPYEVLRKHNNKEKGRFNKAKSKMLEWITKIDNRIQEGYPIDDGTYISKYTPLYEELDALQFVPGQAIEDLLSKKRKVYDNIYQSAGYTKTRAGKIAKELIGFLRYIEEMKKQDDFDLNEVNTELHSIIETKNEDIEYYREKLQSLFDKSEKISPTIGDDTDSYTSIELKFSALKVLLSDKFIQYSDELYKVHCDIESYPVGLDLWEHDLDNYINEEKVVFQKYGKTLTDQHIDKIISVHTIINDTQV